MTRDEAVAILRSPRGVTRPGVSTNSVEHFDLVMQTIYTGDHSREEAEQLVDGFADLPKGISPAARRPSPSFMAGGSLGSSTRSTARAITRAGVLRRAAGATRSGAD